MRTGQQVKVWSVLVVSGGVLGALAFGTAQAQPDTYTTDADFDEGVLSGVEHDTVHDQLQLSEETTTLPVLYIANAGEDTVSRWDTNTNKEVARYHTEFGPKGVHGAFTGATP